MAVIDRPIILPKLAFLTAWSMIGAGELPPAFGTGLYHWITADGRRELEVKAMAALTDLGLARNGRLNALWRSTAAVLAGASREYYAFSNFADGLSCSVLLAARDGDAVRAIVDDNVVALEPVADKWLATALLDTLPETPAADIPRAVFNRSQEHDFPSLEQVMQRPRRAVHQIYVARRDGGGERRRSTPITAIDLEPDGRVLAYVDNEDNLVLLPAGAREFVSTLNKTYAEL
ncbi:ESX secretion-associated protein EspG [Amycolatopsis australiensis]|uniref:EspG family protein n=1 Tax=Amycolatopsis australiensis TaxID=546364 RepID=A0A1K1SWC3_9PSEU|nr:ESX secretion-associated protein EspG [Amycolatopsis australiensis]SFW88606.1 EspG family protein [Amycolatopsis australiensis]